MRRMRRYISARSSAVRGGAAATAVTTAARRGGRPLGDAGTSHLRALEDCGHRSGRAAPHDHGGRGAPIVYRLVYSQLTVGVPDRSAQPPGPARSYEGTKG